MFYNFDISILSCLSRCTGFSHDFNRFMVFVSGSGLLKGGVLLTILWWMWGRVNKHASQEREFFIVTLMSSIIAALTGRLLTLVLPFRLRPGYDPSLSFLVPSGVEPDLLYKGWSSFPSDHAVLLCSLVAGIIIAHRFIGMACLIYVFIVVGLPRVYLGMHYPTDFIAGAIIGMAIGFIANTRGVRKTISRPFLVFYEKYPGLFYVVFFLISVQIITMFADLRMLMMYLLKFMGVNLVL